MRVVGRGHVDYYVPFEFGEKNKSAATRNTPSQTDAQRTDEACTHQKCSYVRCFGRAVPSFGSKYGVVWCWWWYRRMGVQYASRLCTAIHGSTHVYEEFNLVSCGSMVRYVGRHGANRRARTLTTRGTTASQPPTSEENLNKSKHDRRHTPLQLSSRSPPTLASRAGTRSCRNVFYFWNTQTTTELGQ